jgi:pimeloyl-ACP methyl ester carboxylesterase
MEKLATRGYHCVAPFLRGFGPTTFLEPETPRSGDFAALGTDVLELLEALDLRDVIVVGQDWGSPAAEIAAAFAPERVQRLVKLNWYGIYTMAELSQTSGFSYAQLRTLWYVWLLNTPLGEMALTYDRGGFAQTPWEEWSPSWNASARKAALDAVRSSFDNPDFIRLVLSAYRANISPSEHNPDHEPLRSRLADSPAVSCETFVLLGPDDGVERMPLAEEARGRYFTGGLHEEVAAGVGHFPQREAPEAVVRLIVG